MTIRYKLGVDQIPVEVECEQVGYPYRDADGATQYENTHFDTEAEAWDRGAKECLAGISLIGSDIAQIEAQLQRARERAGHAAVEWSNFSRARRHYEDRRCDNRWTLPPRLSWDVEEGRWVVRREPPSDEHTSWPSWPEGIDALIARRNAEDPPPSAELEPSV